MDMSLWRAIFVKSLIANIAAHGKTLIKDMPETLFFVQVRKKKRSLHEATPRKGIKEPNRSAKRNAKNTKNVGVFYLYDKVQFGDKVGWITGFTGTSGAYINDKDDNYITEEGKTYKQVLLSKLKVLKHNNNWISYEFCA